jgi:hypothetical protein
MARTPLTTNTIFYVSTTGSDAADGSISTPWKTINHAVQTIHNSYDLAGWTAEVQCYAGTYTDSVQVNGPFVGQGFPSSVLIRRKPGESTVTVNPGLHATCSITKNSATMTLSSDPGTIAVGTAISGKGIPYPCSVSAKSGTTVTMSAVALETVSSNPVGFSRGYAFSAAFGAAFKIQDLTLNMWNSGADTLVAAQGGTIVLGSSIVFGPNINPFNNMTIAFGGYITVESDYTVDVTSAFVNTTGNPSTGSVNVTVASGAGIRPQMGVIGAGMPAGVYVTAVDGTTVTLSALPTASGTGVALTFSPGGQAHIDLGDGGRLYYDTNGDPAYTKTVTFLGAPFYLSTFLYCNSLSSINIQAVTWVYGPTGMPFIGRSNSIIDTELQGAAYLPGNVYVQTSAASISAGVTSISVASGTGIRVGQVCNGISQQAVTFSSGVTTIAVSSSAHIRIGCKVNGPGIAGGTRVTGVSGTNITISFATTSAQSGVNLNFEGFGVENSTYVTSVSGTTIGLSRPTTDAASSIQLRFAGLIESGAVFQ